MTCDERIVCACAGSTCGKYNILSLATRDPPNRKQETNMSKSPYSNPVDLLRRVEILTLQKTQCDTVLVNHVLLNC
jgi:hypothetical protein